MQTDTSRQRSNRTSSPEAYEINVFDAIHILWARKFFILGAMCLFLAGTLGWIFLQPPVATGDRFQTRWNSYAQVVPPLSNDITSIISKYRVFSGVIDESPVPEMGSGLLLDEFLTKKIYANFLQEINSNLQRAELITNRKYMEGLVADVEGDKNMLVERIKSTGRFNVIPAASEHGMVVIEFSTMVPGVAQKVLQGFIAQVNRSVIEDADNQINNVIDNRVLILRDRINFLEKERGREKLNKINEIASKISASEELKSLEHEGLQAHIRKTDTNSEALMSLKDATLQAELNNLRNHGIPMSYEESLLNHQLSTITKLMTGNVNGNAYRYRVDPSSEYIIGGVAKVASNSRVFMVIVACMAGLIVGSFLVLLQYAYKRHMKSRKVPN